MRDFTKHQDFKQAVKQKQDQFRRNQPPVKLSTIADPSAPVPKARRPYLDTSPMSNPSFTTFANKMLKKTATKGVDQAINSEKQDMQEKYYFLDHTAEVLENYRKFEENKIFDRVLHDER